MIIFVIIGKWPPLRKELLVRLTVRSDCNLSICYFGHFPFSFPSRLAETLNIRFLWLPSLRVTDGDILPVAEQFGLMLFVECFQCSLAC